MTIEYKDSKRIVGLSTDIVDTATYTDDFDTDDWDNMSSRINVNTTTEKLDFAMYRDGANDSAVHDLGAGNVSDTKWVLRWKMNFTAVYASGNGNRLWFGLSSLPQTTNQNTAQDSIMMYQNHDGTDCFSASYSNGTALPQTNTENPDYATGTDYYCELKRTSSTTIESRMWTGGYDGTLLSSAEDSVSNSTIGSVTGLRYVKMSNIYASQGGSVITGTIDDIEFYNGVSSLTNKPTNVPDNSILIEKDTAKRFWFESELAPTYEDDTFSSNWTSTGSKIVTGTNVIDWDGIQNGSVNGISKDLQDSDALGSGNNASDTSWVLRFTYTLSNLASPSSASNQLYIGLSDQNHSTSRSSAQDGIVFMILNDATSSLNLYRISYGDGSGLSSNFQDFAETVATGTKYIELKRTATNEATCAIYSDATYETLVELETFTIATSIIDLRYIAVKMRSSSAVGGTFNGTIDDVEFYNAVTSVTPATWTKDKQVTSGSAICAGGGVTGNVASGAQTSSNYVWGNITAISTARQYPFGVGNASNFTIAGGYNGSASVENSQTWNGTSWATEIGSSEERRDTSGGAGSYDDIIIAFGRNNSGTLLNSASKFNGTTWSAVSSNAGTAREGTVGTGASDSALFAGGYSTGNSSEVNSYNGTAFASEQAMGSAHYGLSMGASASDSAHVAGGYPSGYCADFDGSTWTTTTAYPVASATHFFAGGGGKKDEHLTMGGHLSPSTRYNTTYLWNGTAWITKDNSTLTENKQGGAGDCTAR